MLLAVRARLLGLCRPMTPYKSKSLAGLTLDTHHFGAFLQCKATWKKHLLAVAVCLSDCSALLSSAGAPWRGVKWPWWCSQDLRLNKHAAFPREKLQFGPTCDLFSTSVSFFLNQTVTDWVKQLLRLITICPTAPHNQSLVSRKPVLQASCSEDEREKRKDKKPFQMR